MERPSRPRLESVDALRGIVMILMALDHVRDFVGNTSISPTDLSQASGALFLTRWVTHICAPVFFLLTGTGAYLSRRGRPARSLSGYLFVRGVWLLLLEAVIVRSLGWQFNVDFHLTMLTVLWGLGWAMIVLAGLVYLPTAAAAAFGVTMIAGHNLFDSVRSAHPLWTILHSPNIIVKTPEHIVFVAYPLVPWVGVTAAGYALGQVYDWTADLRRAALIRGGIGLTVAFFVLRTINGYGDPSQWSAQESAAFTVLSFLNTTKYAPSLLFLLMTLGPALVLLGLFDGRSFDRLRPAVVIGKVPMFYYLMHVPLIHFVAIAICYVRYGEIHWMFESPNPGAFPVTPPPGWGVGLPATYAIWLGVVAMLYPVCRWYAGVKRRRTDLWWLRYV